MENWYKIERGKQNLKSKIVKLTWKVAFVFVLLTAAFAVYFYQNAELAKQIFATYLPKAQSVMNEDGTLSYVGVVMNNVFACAMCIGMGVYSVYLPACAVSAVKLHDHRRTAGLWRCGGNHISTACHRLWTAASRYL